MAITGKIVLTVATGMMLSGCGASGTTVPAGSPPEPTGSSSTPVSTGPNTPVPSGSAGPARASVPKCVAADVQGAFSEQDQAAGIHGVQIVVTNTSTHTCTIFGYGGLEMFSGGDGRAANITLARLPHPGPTLVTLGPGAKASKNLSWTAPDIPVPDKPAPDKPVPEQRVGNPDQCSAFIGFAEVILPDDTRAITVDGDLGQICGNRMVDGSAYYSGSTP
ncbi:MAG: DUF4232 domain-containing protein [Pseudonocardiaceae bacterium]